MDDKTKNDFIKLFNQGFEEVVLPQLEEIREEMTTKSDLVKVENRLDTIERKLDRNLDKEMEQDSRLDRIESVSVVVHELNPK